jgi:SAM-dependent methyltransferase
MDHFKDIYAHKAQAYHRMIRAEDVDGNLLPAMCRAAGIAGFSGLRILDVGSGTGRIPMLLSRLAETERPGQVMAVDESLAMLACQKEELNPAGPLVQADGRCLPFVKGWADLAVAGWAIGHFCGWYENDWQAQASRVIQGMLDSVRPGGTVLILETMTTGGTAAAPPSKRLADYYAWLESAWGFQRDVISTDYQFASVEEALECTEFFFGAELGAVIREQGWARLPEWTGVWVRRARN